MWSTTGTWPFNLDNLTFDFCLAFTKVIHSLKKRLRLKASSSEFYDLEARSSMNVIEGPLESNWIESHASYLITPGFYENIFLIKIKKKKHWHARTPQTYKETSNISYKMYYAKEKKTNYLHPTLRCKLSTWQC